MPLISQFTCVNSKVIENSDLRLIFFFAGIRSNLSREFLYLIRFILRNLYENHEVM